MFSLVAGGKARTGSLHDVQNFVIQEAQFSLCSLNVPTRSVHRYRLFLQLCPPMGRDGLFFGRTAIFFSCRFLPKVSFERIIVQPYSYSPKIPLSPCSLVRLMNLVGPFRMLGRPYIFNGYRHRIGSLKTRLMAIYQRQFIKMRSHH